MRKTCQSCQSRVPSLPQPIGDRACCQPETRLVERFYFVSQSSEREEGIKRHAATQKDDFLAFELIGKRFVLYRAAHDEWSSPKMLVQKWRPARGKTGTAEASKSWAPEAE